MGGTRTPENLSQAMNIDFRRRMPEESSRGGRGKLPIGKKAALHEKERASPYLREKRSSAVATRGLPETQGRKTGIAASGKNPPRGGEGALFGGKKKRIDKHQKGQEVSGRRKHLGTQSCRRRSE